ncbi:sensor histidine kinase [Eubacterium sp.]|uniref:sensor histidine kinase n=1 Tax=Eubacterium sp. TaxID=142586 RepID=UPI0039A13C53
MNNIIKHWKKAKIRTQIILTYVLILLISFVMTFSMIRAVNDRYTREEIGKAGVQTVSVLQGNLALLFENVKQLSTYIYFDDIVQDSLRQINSANIDLNYQKNITRSLFNMILSGDYVSGVYIFDQYNNYYSSYKRTPKKVNKQIQETNWYKKMQKAGGNGFFYKGSDGTIEYYEGSNYLCYVRQILDKKDYKPLATLLITFDNTVLQRYFNQVSEASKNQFYIVDSKGNYVIKPQDEKRNFDKYTKIAESITGGYKEVKNDGEEGIVACQSMGIQDWKLVGVFSIDDITSIAPYYSTIIAIIMAINIIFVFLCSTLLTYLIFKPLRKIEEHMQIVENGEFITMPVDDNENEITNLRKVFNHMILSVKELMHRVKEEERIIAKGKLDIIYAQINPHFLYNTLDAISALTLMEENEKCFQMIQALGNFYRNSLNSGLDYISVEDEINSIKSYITILNTRYENQIAVSYDVEESIKKEKVLKLLLQPLVENAVHHGLNGEEGNIEIKVFEQEDEIIFIVSDDGVGMSDEKIKDILEGKTVTGKSGFGLYSLIQRIKLIYEIEDPMIIQSEVGVGTEIIVTVKKIKVEK